MRLKRFSFINKQDIKQPRWHDMTVLIAKHKIGTHNVICFTDIKAGNQWHGEWYVSGDTVRKYPIEHMRTRTGGSIALYAVPLDELEVYEGRDE